MRPPVLPRDRRGTGLSRMVGARAALEEVQNGLCGYSFPTSPHWAPHLPSSPQLTNGFTVYLPTGSPNLQVAMPAHQQSLRWHGWVTSPGQEAGWSPWWMLPLGRPGFLGLPSPALRAPWADTVPTGAGEGWRYALAMTASRAPKDAAELPTSIFLDIQTLWFSEGRGRAQKSSTSSSSWSSHSLPRLSTCPVPTRSSPNTPMRVPPTNAPPLSPQP